MMTKKEKKYLRFYCILLTILAIGMIYLVQFANESVAFISFILFATFAMGTVMHMNRIHQKEHREEYKGD